MARFEGKVALVTGATSGIGRATAIAFARDGAVVVAAGRREAEGAETIRLIHTFGGSAEFMKTDVSVEAEVENLVKRTLSAYGRLDCAFNNAGAFGLSPISEQTEASFDLINDTNVKGVYLCMKHELRCMAPAGRRRDRKLVVPRRPDWKTRSKRLLRKQTCGDWPDPVSGAGSGRAGRQGERGVSRGDRGRHGCEIHGVFQAVEEGTVRPGPDGPSGHA